jgi:hypothetical protein
MKHILIYLIQHTKKYAVWFTDETRLLNLKDLVKDIQDDQYIGNGFVINSDQIGEKWEVKSAKVKKISKNRNQLKATIEVECKLLLRKTQE